MSLPPLVVDLDGTLLRSDLLLETALLFVREQPWRAGSLFVWLGRGKALLKQQLAQHTSLDVTTLPYDSAVLSLIATARGQGRRIVLATASHRLLADQVASHLGVFDEVLATADDHNLSAAAKRDALVARFGARGFDYVGNATDDLPVWQAAREAWLANAGAGVQQRARQLATVGGVLDSRPSSWFDWLQALRLHQWLKNLLIFVPLFAAHRHGQAGLLVTALLAFVGFGLCASAIYVVNDLLDLPDDRRHPTKRRRPFAAGHLGILQGMVVAPLLLLAAFTLALLKLPLLYTLTLAGYAVLTTVYSFWLKRKMVIDVITLAVLYTLRIVAGAVALDIPLSFWLLAFSMFMFLSLALVKRYAELVGLAVNGTGSQQKVRGYFIDDLPMLASLGSGAGYMAVMVLALYINDSRTAQLYRHPQFIWLACPLLLVWIVRAWMLAHRDAMNEDPVIFAVRDHISLIIGALMLLVFWIAA